VAEDLDLADVAETDGGGGGSGGGRGRGGGVTTPKGESRGGLLQLLDSSVRFIKDFMNLRSTLNHMETTRDILNLELGS